MTRPPDDEVPATGAASAPPVESAVADGGLIGLYPTATLRLLDGDDAASTLSRHARWYFRGETVAAARPGHPVSEFSTARRAADDVRAWAAAQSERGELTWPPLVWIAAPQVAAHARLASDGAAVTLADGGVCALRLAPQNALNRSYFDASSARWFASRAARLRGASEGDAFVARTLWPEDFALDAVLPSQPLDAALPGAAALRARVRADPHGGARSGYGAHLLWQRAPGTPIAPGRAVIGVMLNGAQGDDDEAHGGHFALATGRTRADGAIGDWLVNNFYSLDIVSEKGILAAPLPLDNYLADLNSGQGWYRPSYLLVAVLCDDRAAVRLQGALNRVYHQFYRHQLVYEHATMNCAGISVDVLRALGWPIPARGPTSRALAAAAFPYFLARERSLARARTACDYLAEDQTRLLPAAAFEDVGASLLELAGAAPATTAPRPSPGPLAAMLAADVEAIAFLRMPQFPSSRAFGNAPAVTTREYRSLVPTNPDEVQIVPVPPRPFPDALRDPDLLPAPHRPSDAIAAAWATIAALVAAALAWWLIAG